MNANSAENGRADSGKEKQSAPVRSTRAYVASSSASTRPMLHLGRLPRRRSALQLPWVGLFPGR